MSREIPPDLPEWATSGVEILDPPGGVKVAGWLPDQRPPSKIQNWYQEKVFRYLEHLRDMQVRSMRQFIGFAGPTVPLTANRVLVGPGAGTAAKSSASTSIKEDGVIVLPSGTVDFYVSQRGYGGRYFSRANPSAEIMRCGAFAPVLARWMLAGVGGRHLSSIDGGFSWLDNGIPDVIQLNDMVVGTPGGGAEVVVVCGDSGSTGGDAALQSSTNGTTWVEGVNPLDLDLRGTAFDPVIDLYVCVGEHDGSGSGFPYLITSPTGAAPWTQRTTLPWATTSSIQFLRGVVSNGRGRFVTVGNPPTGGGAGPMLGWSADGITWNRIDDAPLETPADTLEGVTFAAGRFIAWTASLDVIYSYDGALWFNAHFPRHVVRPAGSHEQLDQINDMHGSDEGIVAIGSRGGNSHLFLSPLT